MGSVRPGWNSADRRRRMIALGKKFGWYCHYCGCELKPTKLNKPVSITDPRRPTIDHIIPLSKGGSRRFYNTVLSCVDCNTEKADEILT